MMQDESSTTSASTPKNVPLHHVEVVVRSEVPSNARSELKNRIHLWIKSRKEGLAVGKNGEIELSLVIEEDIPRSVGIVKIRIVNDDHQMERTSPMLVSPECSFLVHTFDLSQEEICTEEIEPSGGSDEWTAGCDSLALPHATLDGLWENLIFDSKIKCHLLEYAQSAMLFSDRKVSEHIVHWNRILLLHGLPGTGKTSLCRALAHKLAIRMSDRFPRARLLEIHSHSLFSKWFSTSGKLVSALFSMVRDMVEDDPHSLVCVLIDEVESLASSRSNTGSGDPSDAMRAVNSLLTSLDRLRSFPNVLVLATTNITGRIDDAFVDRVDLKLHIGLPILRARYEILRTCLEELMRVGIVAEEGLAEFWFLSGEEEDEDRDTGENEDVDASRLLLNCAQRAEGLSGRSLRRLPLQAHAQFLSTRNIGGKLGSAKYFLRALLLAIDSEQKARSEL